jgi:hypothetical protein
MMEIHLQAGEEKQEYQAEIGQRRECDDDSWVIEKHITDIRDAQ